MLNLTPTWLQPIKPIYNNKKFSIVVNTILKTLTERVLIKFDQSCVTTPLKDTRYHF